MPISQILLTSSSGSVSTPTYTLTPEANNVNEGSSIRFDVGGTNIPDDIYWWTVDTNAGDVTTSSGSIEVIDNASYFIVTPYEDSTTEGAETFTVSLRRDSITGTILVTSSAVTINDTSLDSTTGSFEFTGVQFQDITLDGNVSDWALDKTGTIEWWQKAPNSNSLPQNFNGGIFTQGNAGGDGGLDIFAAGGNIALGLGGGGVMPFVEEPASTTTWTHLAISFAPNPDNLNVGKSRVFFNGLEQSLNNTSVLLTNSTDAIRIGSRVPDANYQNFTGKITNIHISTANLYTGNFTPTIRTTPTTGTVFLMNSSSPTQDLALYELNGIATVTSNGNTLYFSKATYPNLNNQVRLGDTVVNVTGTGASTSTTTGEVFTADPNNWGVTIFPSQGGGTKNFSGPGRHTITGGIYTLSADVVNLRTATHSAGNQGSSEIWIDSNPSNDAWAGSIPVGASVISSVSGRFTVTNVASQVDGKWLIGVDAGTSGIFIAGETHTFIW